jgi:membrane protease YdiL (CAAX protease family)
MLESAEETLHIVGVALTLAFFAFFWALRGKLNDVMGVEYVQWNRTSPVFLVRAVALGLVAGAVMAWWFRNYDLGTEPPFAELWIAVTWGPLIEEVMFRGYLFSMLEGLLRRWMRSPGWLVVIGIAAVFALGHLVKTGITPVQIASIFVTGTLYGWLRLDSGSTVPPVCSHISYNSVIYLAAAFLRQQR